MIKVDKLEHIPEKSLILNGFKKVDYSDSYKIKLKSNDDNIDKITTKIFKIPKWVGNLLKLRNFMVKRFGLKTDDTKEMIIKPYYSIGSKAVYFNVLDRNENEIVLSENDKHLNFRISVMIEKDSAGSTIYLSTIVQFNIFFGRLYFFPVKPLHRIIIKSLLKKYAHEN
jgi:Protein of unknown function (DUF2867)